MTEYYYTQSLATAAAAEFEQRFLECDSYCEGINLEMQWFRGFIPHAKKWRFPRTSHNEALMEKKIGDILMLSEIFWTSELCNSMKELPPETITCGIGEDMGIPNTLRIIISRPINGKHCTFPKWDKERV